MKKLLLLFAAVLMASTGLWAETQNVSYLYPVYNTGGDATSGIKEWKTASVDATVVENASEQVTWTAGWYVVTGTDVTLSQGAICSGNVRLILADGAKLTATGIDDVLNSTPGIQVSGDGNSLTIYGQTAQTGILKATGKTYSAGIGGNGADGLRDGSNITINGGTVTANGGSQAAAIGGGLRGNGSNIIINGGTVTAKGSAAGIGGGNRGNGTNIIINGGTVTARGGDGSDGIGNGANATTPSSNIFVATWCIVKAGSSLTPTDVIENTGSDLATSLEGKRNVIVETPKFAVTYGDNITVSPAFASGAEIAAGTQITFTAADRTADSYLLWGFYEESTFDTPITTGVNGQAYTVTVTDAAISVYARYGKLVSYVYPVYNDPDDVTKGVKEWETGTASPIEITSSDTPVTLGEAGKTTWYVVTGEDVTLSQGAICYGDVNLILADGAKLTATGADDKAGITTAADLGNSLTIYGQTAQSGQLEATGGIHGAGIGGGNNRSCAEITINGGTVTANGGDGASGIGGGYNRSGYYITINGGKVKANGGEMAAGIGGGINGDGNEITINGGTVEANGGEMAAGIGGGRVGKGTNITINGGTVTAKGGSEGAGIGGGDHGIGSDITITGGTVTAKGGLCAAGIGGGIEGSGFNVTINGGTVTATGGESGVCIGSVNSANPASSIFVATNLIMKADGNNPPTTVISNTGADLASSLAGKRYVTIEPNSVSYVYPVYNDPDDVTKGVKEWGTETVNAIEVISSDAPVTWGEAGKETWYVVTGADVTLSQGAICAGDVNLILADGAKLTATGLNDYPYVTPGIQVSGEGNSLTIYGQVKQSGQLEAIGGYFNAGIGGGEEGAGSYITINGGVVTANGGVAAAGIGGGGYGSGSNITINGGTVTANGGGDGAGIGGGYCGSGSNITITGGTITANGRDGSAGIGNGADYDGLSSNIFVATTLKLASNNADIVTEIAPDHTSSADLASILADKWYVIIGAEMFPVTYGDNIIVSPQFESGVNVACGSVITFTASTFSANGYEFKGFYKDSAFKTPITEDVSGLTYTATVTDAPILVYAKYLCTYIDATGQEQKVIAKAITDKTNTLSAGWYVVADDNVSTGTLTCQGDVHLILLDGAKLTATGTSVSDSHDGHPGIEVSGDGNSLTIYGQAEQSGQLEATGGQEAAGIGGGGYGSGSNITINGGTVTANGGIGGAGIGGGAFGSGSDITINGGTVTANGGYYGAGIGGGRFSSGSDITINGGTVTANGGRRAAGIGGVEYGSGSNIIINGGTVTANGGEEGAGIGGGEEGAGSYITINGGTVTANGGQDAAGIGSGTNGPAASDIFVATILTLKADGNNPPTTVITNNGGDLTESLEGKRYVTIEPNSATSFKVQATPADENEGSVAGGGIYEVGTEVTLTATPAENYVFEKWSDGTTANPYVFTATKDVTLTAFFTEVSRYITDGTEYTAAESKFLPEVIYTRTFDNTNWQALYVPFSIDYEEWSEKFDIAKIRNFIEYDDDDNGTVDRTYLVAIKKASGSTEPNYPYLIRAKEAGTYSLVLKDKTLEAAKITTIDCRSVENEYTFTGTYTKITDMYANGYYALAGGVLCKAESAGVALNPQRWYMEVTSRTGSSSTKAQSIQILVDGEEGIMAPSTSPRGESPATFDLMGRRMMAPAKGISIVNGKKIIK